MAVVTVNGAGNQAFLVSYTTTDALASAQNLANSINTLVAGGTVVTQIYTNGAIVTPPGAGKVGELVVTTGGAVNVGLDTIAVDDATAPVTITGAIAGGVSVIAGSGGLTFNTLGGSATVVAGDGANLVGTPTIAGGSLNVRTGAGNDTITAVSGTNVVQAGLGNNLIVTGTASDLVITSGTDTIMGTAGSDTVIAFGSGSDLINSAGNNMFFVGVGTSASTINGGSGVDTVFTSTGGGLGFAGSGGNSTLVGGTAAATLVGATNGDQLFSLGQSVAGGPNASLQLVAGAGNETVALNFGNLSDVVFAGNSVAGGTTNTLIGRGGGNDTIFAGTGNFTAGGGTGADLFAFFNGRAGGIDFINNFNAAGGDRLTLQGYAAGEVQADLAKATIYAAAGGAPASTVIQLSDKTTIVFGGVTNLNSSNFV